MKELPQLDFLYYCASLGLHFTCKKSTFLILLTLVFLVSKVFVYFSLSSTEVSKKLNMVPLKVITVVFM